jgi:hypothetical protein
MASIDFANRGYGAKWLIGNGLQASLWLAAGVFATILNMYGVAKSLAAHLMRLQ